MDEEEHFLQASEKRATSARTMSDEPNTNRGILDELAERLGNFHESARALADCLQTRSVTRKTHQSMIDVLVPRQRVKNLVLVPTRWLRNHVLVPETASEKPCSRSETLAEKSCSRPETVSEKTLFSFRDAG